MFFSWRTIVCERGARRDEEGKQREKRGIGTKVRIEKNARHATRNVHGSPRAACLLASSYHCPGTGHSPDDYHTESLSYTTSSRNRKCRRAQTFISFVRVRDFADGISDLSFALLYRSFVRLFANIHRSCIARDHIKMRMNANGSLFDGRGRGYCSVARNPHRSESLTRTSRNCRRRIFTCTRNIFKFHFNAAAKHNYIDKIWDCVNPYCVIRIK